MTGKKIYKLRLLYHLLKGVIMITIFTIFKRNKSWESHKPDGIDEEFTSLTFFWAITFKDTAVSAEFCKKKMDNK